MAVDGYEALSKADLLATIQRERAEWDQLVEQAADRIEQPGVEGDWSVKDIIAHICVYERWQVGLLGEPTRQLPAPPPGVDLSEVHQRNAWFHKLDRERSVEDIRTEAAAVHQQLLALIEARSEDDLRTVYTFTPEGTLVPVADAATAAPPRWPLWRWFVSNTFDHYRQHIPLLRAWLRAPAQASSRR
jgi:hypothetical protein